MATYTITVTKTPVPEAGIVKVGSSTASGITQEEGTDVNILASPASGYFFVSWEIDSVVVSTSSSYTFVMPSNNIILTANFEATPTPSTDEQPEIYDTDCPRFFFVSNLNNRFFTGDVVNLNAYTYQEVNEPISFDTGMFKLERDLNYHGFNYEFGVDELQYELGSEGFTYLRTQLLTGGTDSDIKFVYGFGDIDSLTIFYIGKVDFNEYKEVDNGEKVSFSLVELDFDNLLQTAFEVPQEVELAEVVNLYSKVIPKRVEYKIEVPQERVLYTYPYRAWFADAFQTTGAIDLIQKSSPTGYLFFNDGRAGDNDFETFFTYDFQVTNLAPTDLVEGDKPVFIANEAGDYTIDIKFWMGVIYNFVTFPVQYYKLTLVHTRSDGTVVSSNQYTQDNYYLTTQIATTVHVFEFNRSFNYSMLLDDKMYIYIEIDTSDSTFASGDQISAIIPVPFNYDYNVPQIQIIGQTRADNSACNIVRSYDALNSVCKQATGVSYDIVKSNFFNGGCGDLMYLTNGFNVRSVAKNLKVAPKKLIDMLKNLYNLGWGVEYNEVKQELVAIEPVEYFYRDVNILNLDSISDYQKEIDSSLIYNEIEVGFSKYSKQRETDKGFTLDDFHTKHTYQTPIKTNKSKLSIISDLVLSAYEIEILRRKQFIKGGSNTQSNYNEDEEIYGIQMQSASSSASFTYPNAFVLSENNGYTIVQGEYNFQLQIGDEVSYTSRNGDVSTRIITLFWVYSDMIIDPITGVISFQNPRTWIGFSEPLTTPDTGAGDVSITKISGEILLSPEGAEPFDTIENLLSPATTYNLRYTPKRILYNWAKLFAGSFFTKTGTDQVVFKQGDGNVELVTQFSASESCLLGDVNRSVITEGGNVNISELGGRNYLFLPIKVSFSTSLSFEQLTDLKKCLRGQDGTRDYGYVTITSPCGDAEKIFITSVEYSGVTEEAKIEGYLKEITGIE